MGELMKSTLFMQIMRSLLALTAPRLVIPASELGVKHSWLSSTDAILLERDLKRFFLGVLKKSFNIQGKSALNFYEDSHKAAKGGRRTETALFKEESLKESFKIVVIVEE